LENIKYLFTEQPNTLFRSDAGIADKPLQRTRRQNMGGGPEAYSFNLTDAEHQFARIIYSGEGSKVHHLIYYYLFRGINRDLCGLQGA